MINFFNLEAWISFRYLKSKRRSRFISFIGFISVIGIALGVATLIIVLSVMNGFQKEVKNKLFEVAPHMQAGYYDEAENANYSKLQKLIEKNNNILETTPYINKQALLSNSGEIIGTEILGIEVNSYLKVIENKNIKNSKFINELIPDKFNIILGEGLAIKLDLEIGEKVTIITPEGNATIAGFIPRFKQFTLIGTIKSNIYELNNSLALINIQDAQKLFKLNNSVTGIRIKLKNPQNASEISKSILPEKMYKHIWINDWSFQNKSYFEAVALEKKMMFIIMALITTVASFNLISSLVMTVNEKKSDIAILRTLGLSPKNIMKIFIIQGVIYGCFGILFGAFFGILITKNISSIFEFFENLFKMKFIKSEVYFLDYIPSYIDIHDIFIIIAISFILVCLATIYPSIKASKTKPAEALRYE